MSDGRPTTCTVTDVAVVALTVEAVVQEALKTWLRAQPGYFSSAVTGQYPNVTTEFVFEDRDVSAEAVVLGAAGAVRTRRGVAQRKVMAFTDEE